MSVPRESPLTPDAASQADADADHVWTLALGLDDHASPERTIGVTSLLLEHVDVDHTRLTAAAAVCRSRHVPGEDDGYLEAGQLIGQACQLMEAAGADTDEAAREQLRRDIHAQWHPEPVPFDWERRRRLRARWWLRYLTARRARIRHLPAETSAGIQRLTIELGRRSVGRMLYQVCDDCNLVLIGKVVVDSDYQGINLGTRLVLQAHAYHPGYTWSTTAQYLTAGTFWPQMARRTGAAFTAASGCPHMARDRFASPANSN